MSSGSGSLQLSILWKDADSDVPVPVPGLDGGLEMLGEILVERVIDLD